MFGAFWELGCTVQIPRLYILAASMLSMNYGLQL